jgi:hypothetical protein
MIYESAVVLYGCSVIWGQGLERQQRLGYQLEQLIDQPVIVAARPGTGPLHHSESQRLIHQQHRPCLEIVCWSAAQRVTVDGVDYGAWRWKPEFNQDPEHWLTVADQARQAMQDRSPRLWEYSWYKPLIKRWSVQSWRRRDWEDLADDQAHPGPRAVYKFAQELAARIRNEL